MWFIMVVINEDQDNGDWSLMQEGEGNYFSKKKGWYINKTSTKDQTGKNTKKYYLIEIWNI